MAPGPLGAAQPLDPLNPDGGRARAFDLRAHFPQHRDKVLLPLAFCRECGQDYYTEGMLIWLEADATIRLHSHGRRSLDDRIGGQSARSLMERMLIHSDNRATDILLNNIGGPRAVHDWLQQNKISGVRMDRTIAQLLSDRRDLFDRRDSSTPQAMVELLRRIYKAELIKPESRDYLLDLMAQCQTGKNRIRALLPTGTPVENKTGTLTGLTDDVGFITMPDGHRIAVAIFTRGGSDRPRTIAEAARAIYDGFTRVLSWPMGSPAYSTP